MVGWHHWLNGYEFEQTPRASEGQGSLACCRPWGRKELDMAGQLNKEQRVYAYMYMNTNTHVLQHV